MKLFLFAQCAIAKAFLHRVWRVRIFASEHDFQEEDHLLSLSPGLFATLIADQRDSHPKILVISSGDCLISSSAKVNRIDCHTDGTVELCDRLPIQGSWIPASLWDISFHIELKVDDAVRLLQTRLECRLFFGCTVIRSEVNIDKTVPTEVSSSSKESQSWQCVISDP
jgi:hypothetical protein